MIYSEALPSEQQPSVPQHSASPPPQEANNPIEMIPRIEIKYFMLFIIKFRAYAQVMYILSFKIRGFSQDFS